MNNENAQVHTVVYCSGVEHSVKCVHAALEMETSKEEQRGVVHCKTICAQDRPIKPLRLMSAWIDGLIQEN